MGLAAASPDQIGLPAASGEVMQAGGAAWAYLEMTHTIQNYEKALKSAKDKQEDLYQTYISPIRSHQRYLAAQGFEMHPRDWQKRLMDGTSLDDKIVEECEMVNVNIRDRRTFNELRRLILEAQGARDFLAATDVVSITAKLAL